MNDNNEIVIVLDFGGQYAQLIARRVRELNVYCEIWPYDTDLSRIEAAAPKAIIFSGGPNSIYAPHAPHVDARIFELGIPILGICYGMQLIAHCFGGKVERAQHREFGPAALEITDANGLFHSIESGTSCWMSHGDHVKALPAGFACTASTPSTAIAAMRHETRLIFAVQFHPEVEHTPEGQVMLRNFLYRIAGCSGKWNMEAFIEKQVAAIKQAVGTGRAVCGLSGGVDSSVAAVLVDRAIGPALTCIFVDHGLLRLGEAEQVIQTFRDKMGLNVVYVDAKRRFLDQLKGVTDPEEKRKIIGHEFIRVFEDEAAKLGRVDFLVQGTIYPDVIESGTTTAAVIKSHHNVGGLPEDLKFQLIEPLRELFKDEVRQVGRQLGIPAEIIGRHPFPGPGLAIRVIGEITEDKLKILRHADAIFIEEIRQAGWYDKIWQAFAVLPDVRSVGVMGDERTYSHLIALRAVVSSDAMTADWARIPYDLLARISTRIVNEVEGVNRVVYDITSKPPATIEWE